MVKKAYYSMEKVKTSCRSEVSNKRLRYIIWYDRLNLR